MYCMSLAKPVICGRQYGWRYLYCTYYDHVRYKQTCRACGGFLALCLYCLQYISNVLIQKMVLGIRQCSRFVACSSRIIERMAISLHDGICSLFSTQPPIRGFFISYERLLSNNVNTDLRPLFFNLRKARIKKNFLAVIFFTVNTL